MNAPVASNNYALVRKNIAEEMENEEDDLKNLAKKYNIEDEATEAAMEEAIDKVAEELTKKLDKQQKEGTLEFDSVDGAFDDKENSELVEKMVEEATVTISVEKDGTKPAFAKLLEGTKDEYVKEHEELTQLKIKEYNFPDNGQIKMEIEEKTKEVEEIEKDFSSEKSKLKDIG